MRLNPFLASSLILFAFLFSAPATATDVVDLPDLDEVAPGNDTIWIPFVSGGQIQYSTTENNLLFGSGTSVANGQYGRFRLDMWVDVHYVPEGSGNWRTERICQDSDERTNDLGAVSLRADCSGGPPSMTPRRGTGIFYCIEARLYMDTLVYAGMAFIDGDGSCGSSRIYNG